MDKLTRRQGRVLTFLKTYLKRHGYPPTRREIALSVGSQYPTAGQDHLNALERKGYVKVQDGVSRGIQIMDHQREFK